MTDTENDRAIDDAKCADKGLLFIDENGKVFEYFTLHLKVGGKLYYTTLAHKS